MALTPVFNFNKKFLDIDSFKILNEHCLVLILKDKRALSLVDLNTETNKVQLLDFRIMQIFMHNKDLIIVNELNEVFFINQSSLEIKNKIQNITFDFFSEKSGYGISQKFNSYDPIDFSCSLFKLNDSQIKVCFQKGMLSLRLDKSILISNSAEGVAFYDDVGNKKYQIIFSELTLQPNTKVNHTISLHKVIGVYNKILWIALSTGRLLGLNYDTGELIYDLKKPLSYDEDFFVFARYSIIDSDNGKIFGLWYEFYWEIDLNDPTNKYELFSIKDTCRENKIRPNMPISGNWSWYNDTVLFGEVYESPNDAAKNNVGIFNRREKKITWAIRIGEEGVTNTNLTKLEMLGNRLFILDGKAILYVYEKENTQILETAGLG